MAESSKKKRTKPWKTVVINGKRKYIFGENLAKDQSKVRAPHRISTSQMVREDRSTSSTNISLTESECHSDSQPQFSCDQYDENTTPEVVIDCQPPHSSLVQNTEANVEIAYATELSRLEMVTVVTKCAFVLPDFNVESKRIKEMNFIVVHRSVWLLLPTNQYDWLYSCSCSPRRSQLLSGLSKLLQQEPSHLRNSVCIHIKAICHLLLDYDSQHGITPEEQEKESSMNDHTYKYDVIKPLNVALSKMDQNLFSRKLWTMKERCF
ncbi:uncharacterized protein LOC114542819 [Dendronephthya gigantea]|uniref:uncharacterized protein LOC114542819 n=2 Tax=Dendronephthya gigantea TaxID=151771 RepID=UPI00106A9D51|nr:uncharacterized protein LOC114542819 [Dendronephthya gigantea]